MGGKETTLTTTSYAILGLLALRSWTAYELAKQMKRTLHEQFGQPQNRPDEARSEKR